MSHRYSPLQILLISKQCMLRFCALINTNLSSLISVSLQLSILCIRTLTETNIHFRERSLRNSMSPNLNQPSMNQHHLDEYEQTSVNTMRRLQEFQMKSMKYHQREITFLTNNVDPYHHLIEARFTVLERAFLAKIRTRKRTEIAGRDGNYDIDVKKHFLCYFFGRTDYYMNGKKQEIEALKQKAIKDGDKDKDKEKDKDKDKDKEDNDDNNEDDKDKKGKKKKKKKKKESELVMIEDDNIMYIGDDDFILTLSNPDYSKEYPCDDKFIERILVLADTLPKELDELVSFQTSVESKRKAHLEKMVKSKKKVRLYIILPIHIRVH